MEKYSHAYTYVFCFFFFRIKILYENDLYTDDIDNIWEAAVAVRQQHVVAYLKSNMMWLATKIGKIVTVAQHNSKLIDSIMSIKQNFGFK